MSNTINNQNVPFPLAVNNSGSSNSYETEGSSSSNSLSASSTGTRGMGATGTIIPQSAILQNATFGAGSGDSDEADADGSPALPNVTGSQSSAGSAGQPVAAWLTMNPGSLSQAMGMLANLAADNMMTMQKIRTEAGVNEYTTQEQAAYEQQAQVQGERSSAWTKFAGSIGAAVTVGALGVKGGSLGAKNNDAKWSGIAQALNVVSNPVSQLVNSGTDLIDKTAGGQYQADQAKIAKAYLDMLTSVFKSEDDSFNTEVQNAQKSLQNVWDLTRSVNDQNSQTIINTASNV